MVSMASWSSQIVGIDHLEIKALSCGKASIHRAAMTSVFLMDRTDHIRVLGHKAIADLRSVVLRGTIVNEDDLDIGTPRGNNEYTHFSI